MLNMTLDNGVLASYEQCHFTPDYWRNYTVIGDAGRIENMGDGGGHQIHIFESRRSGPGKPDAVEVISRGDRSEEHTSELQSRGHLVCRLLLEQKKKQERPK